jgi:hypothetical protein
MVIVFPIHFIFVYCDYIICLSVTLFFYDILFLNSNCYYKLTVKGVKGGQGRERERLTVKGVKGGRGREREREKKERKERGRDLVFYIHV